VTINKEQYKFGKELGSGAFGAVYSARHASDSQTNIFLFD
jgi:serine/threonine protein kinase